ncbi:GerMN domain-containing protein [Leucobacter insecticola]|uniref:GerMN domain-containing protein n=1 Tax=Leucobacter insecticola TaxID=2714934 RepID=UPI001FCC9DEC|nr:GerMN domain-containing protein [Leucobacter insecticola]
MKIRFRSRRILQAGAIACATLLLAGCNAIPSSGPVELGLTDLKQVEQLVQFNPSGPLQGSSQEGIVRGFVQAATSSSDDYSVAREFLSVGYANQWDPYYGVLIDDGNRSYREEGKSAGVLSLAAAANVDGEGILVPAEPGPATDMRFEFEREGDEWRISSAPSGIILDRSDFLAIWSSHELNFIGPGGLLVPESRWYLSRTALATEIVSGLLEGPGQGLQESVRTGFPAGSALVGGTVTVVDGRAKIDVTGEVLEAGPEALEEVVQQLRASLNSVQG